MRSTFPFPSCRGWMIASSSFSIAGGAAAPLSVFTLKPLSVHGLWLAVMTIPAFALRRIVAHENDCVGAALDARCTFTPFAATTSAAAAAKCSETKRRSKPMTTPRSAPPFVRTHCATACEQMRTASNVYSSAIRARQPSVPNEIRNLLIPTLARIDPRSGPGARPRHFGFSPQRLGLRAGGTIELHDRSPEVEGSGERSLQRDGRRPTRSCAEARRVEQEHRGDARPHAVFVELGPDRDAREAEQHVEDRADRDRLAAAHVVRRRIRVIDRGRGLVRGGHVAHVEEFAAGIELAVAQDRLGDPGLRLGDALRELRRCEAGMLARPDLVRRAQDGDARPSADLAEDRIL